MPWFGSANGSYERAPSCGVPFVAAAYTTSVSETVKRKTGAKRRTLELRSKLGVNSRIEAGLNAGASVSGMVDGVAAITCPCQHRSPSQI